jgi:hypothetical protein
MYKNREKSIILFLTSQTLSLFGSMLVRYAITWYIALQTQSGEEKLARANAINGSLQSLVTLVSERVCCCYPEPFHAGQ